jgi:hypothetical protein
MFLKGKTPVSERGLMQRINRYEIEQDTHLVVKKARIFAKPHLGVYYLLDTKAGRIVKYNINLEQYGRERGVLAAWEGLVKGLNQNF